MDVTEGQQLQTLSRDRRLALGLSQEAVAIRAGVSRKWVSEFERGKPSADLSLVLRLLAALGLRVEVHGPDLEGDDAETDDLETDDAEGDDGPPAQSDPPAPQAKPQPEPQAEP